MSNEQVPESQVGIKSGVEGVNVFIYNGRCAEQMFVSFLRQTKTKLQSTHNQMENREKDTMLNQRIYIYILCIKGYLLRNICIHFKKKKFPISSALTGVASSTETVKSHTVLCSKTWIQKSSQLPPRRQQRKQPVSHLLASLVYRV